jgi:hypothetical protein
MLLARSQMIHDNVGHCFDGLWICVERLGSYKVLDASLVSHLGKFDINF